MEDSYNIKAVILSRQDFRENDVLVIFFSKENGVFSLVARGAKKKTSKLVGHLEPMNLVDLMILKGKQYDYVGSVKNIEVFYNIKNNLEKLKVSTKIIRVFKKFIKEGENEDRFFNLLFESFQFIENNEIDLDFFYNIFLLKFLAFLGFSLELDSCISCQEKILPNNNYLDISRGGLLCDRCYSKNNLTISNDCIKMLKLAKDINVSKISKITSSEKLKDEFIKIVGSFEKYCSY